MSRRSSVKPREDEFYLECKAAFLTIYDEIEDRIESKKTLNTLLQTTGRNPSKAKLEKFWPRDTEELSFDDFLQICKKEPVTSADDLMKAFRKIDINGDGYISLDELYKIMNANGENMSRDEVRKIIDDVDDNKDGRLDYNEFTNMVIQTSEESKKFSVKVMERKERKKRRKEKGVHSGHGLKEPTDDQSGEALGRKELTDDQSGEGKGNLGSHTSLRSCQENKATEKSELDDTNMGSHTSLRAGGQNQGSRVSLRSKHGSEFGSKASLKQDVEKDVLGSRVSLRSKSGDAQLSAEVTGSKVSLRYVTKQENTDITGSKVSLRSVTKQENTDITGSKVSLRSVTKGSKTPEKQEDTDVHGSKVSLRSGLGERVHGSRVSLKASSGDVTGSKVSLRSASGEVQGSTESHKRGRGSKASVKDADSGENSDDTIKDVANEGADGPKTDETTNMGSDPKVTQTQAESPRSPKKEEPQSTAVKVKQSSPKPLEKSLNSGKTGLPPRPVSAKAKTSPKKTEKAAKLSPKSLVGCNNIVKSKATDNSARTVGEEIDYDDDVDIVSTGRPTPRVDLNSSRKETPRAEAKQTPRTDSKTRAKKEEKDEESQGSRTSLRSGDHSTGTPVPSPRKTLSSRLSEDDVPRPSPRTTIRKEGKGKSPSVRSMAKLPDPRSLKDWTKFTSKGCFFYEEDEIVTHVFTLKLRDDSSVFLSAYPINEPNCVSLPSTEPVDTALYIFDNRGRLVTFSEQRDVTGKYGVKLDLTAGEYQVLPYTTGCRFKQRQADQQHQMKEAKLVKKDKEDKDKVVITSAFRRALEDIFDLCDLDGNGTMSYDEFNWFNLRTSGEELEEDEWKVVEERTTLENGEITKQGFIELNEMEAEDVKGDTEDLWITLTSMGMNKALIMDEACPYRLDVYVEETVSKKPTFKITGIESLEKKEFADEICKYILEKGDPVKVRNMKDLYMCTYKSEHRASIVVDNRSRSTVNLEVDCSKSRNVVSNRDTLDYTFEIDPQTSAIAHHLLPRSELSDWTINATETIH